MYSRSPIDSQNSLAIRQAWEVDLDVVIEQRHWLSVVEELCLILRLPRQKNLLCLLLGQLDPQIRNTEHQRHFSLLTIATRKRILLSWIKDSAPTKTPLAHSNHEVYPSWIHHLRVTFFNRYTLWSLGSISEIYWPCVGIYSVTWIYSPGEMIDCMCYMWAVALNLLCFI